MTFSKRSYSILSLLILVLFGFYLMGCSAETKPISNQNSPDSQPGERPTAGDAGGADKIYSTKEEVIREITNTHQEMLRNGFYKRPKLNIFSRIEQVANFVSEAKIVMPEGFKMNFPQLEIVFQEDIEQRLRQRASWTEATKNFSNELEIIKKILEEVPDQNAFRSILSQSKISFNILECSPDMSHKLAAVSAHRVGATICFNTDELSKVPRELLRENLIGLFTHEFMHLLGFREQSSLKIHRLLRLSWEFYSDFTVAIELRELVASLTSLVQQVVNLRTNSKRTYSTERNEFEESIPTPNEEATLLSLRNEINNSIQQLLKQNNTSYLDRDELEYFFQSSFFFKSQVVETSYEDNVKDDFIKYFPNERLASRDSIYTFHLCRLVDFASGLVARATLSPSAKRNQFENWTIDSFFMESTDRPILAVPNRLCPHSKTKLQIVPYE